MKLIKYLYPFLFLVACEADEGLDISGNWNLDHKQCGTYAYYQSTKIFFNIDDSLGNTGYVIPFESDSVFFNFNLINEDEFILLEGSSDSKWIGKHEILSWGRRNLTLKVASDSCDFIYRFNK